MILPQTFFYNVHVLNQGRRNTKRIVFRSLVILIASGILLAPLVNAEQSIQVYAGTRTRLAYASTRENLQEPTTSNLTTSVLQDINGSYQRWRDVAENTYAGSYRVSYSYGQANVSVTYSQSGANFSGTFDATGLKPNFAYQLKLQGKPSEDPVSDQRLKDIGRSYDIALNETIGYVVFDFIVTDRNGEAHCNFSLANSYHVLWKVSQRTPQPNDSSPKSVTVQGGPEDPPQAYLDAVGPTGVEVYAQWEKGIPGNVQLPAGAYNVRFIITEESFHSSQSDTTGGYWSTVMSGDVSFLINSSTHDVALSNLSASKTVVGQDLQMYFNVTVENDGDYAELFNVSVSANSTQIASESVNNIGTHAAEILSFSWNTSGFSRGNYNISLVADTVPNETNTTNNSVSTSITVSFPGDVNGDGSVDIYDAILLASAFNSNPRSPNWKANADINGDEVVDVYDAIILAANFSLHAPL